QRFGHHGIHHLQGQGIDMECFAEELAVLERPEAEVFAFTFDDPAHHLPRIMLARGWPKVFEGGEAAAADLAPMLHEGPLANRFDGIEIGNAHDERRTAITLTVQCYRLAVSLSITKGN